MKIPFDLVGKKLEWCVEFRFDVDNSVAISKIITAPDEEIALKRFLEGLHSRYYVIEGKGHFNIERVN